MFERRAFTSNRTGTKWFSMAGDNRAGRLGWALRLVEPRAPEHHVGGVYAILDFMVRHEHGLPPERD